MLRHVCTFFAPSPYHNGEIRQVLREPAFRVTNNFNDFHSVCHGTWQFRFLRRWVWTITVFWDAALRSLLHVHRRFRNADCLHHQGATSQKTVLPYFPLHFTASPPWNKHRNVAQQSVHLLRISEVQCSDLGAAIGYTEVFLPGQCQHCTLKQATTSAFHIISHINLTKTLHNPDNYETNDCYIKIRNRSADQLTFQMWRTFNWI
jgi:hypothetical protein